MLSMLTIRRATDRMHTQIGWLDSRHTFSFGEHHDPRYMGFRALRVINEDRVAPGKGFGTHSHRDIEILSCVLEGALQHQDSLGNGSIIKPGDIQRMTAGTGVLHSEQNASNSEPVHFLQIWIQPDRQRLQPGYQQRAFPAEDRNGRLTLLASRDGRENSVTIHQDIALYSAALEAGDCVSHALSRGRHAWIQVARGEIRLNNKALRAGDGAAFVDEPAVELDATGPAEVLLIDLA
jgi:redox-sensitive bicupin YhaK (pirin superfamily)